MARQSLQGGLGGGGQDGSGAGPKPEMSVGQYAKMARIPQRELIVQGTERDPRKKKDDPRGEANEPDAKDSKLHMPAWIFDNDFDGRPPLNANEELNRMEKELMAVLTDLERMIKRQASSSPTRSMSLEQTPPDIGDFLAKLGQTDGQLQQSKPR